MPTTHALPPGHALVQMRLRSDTWTHWRSANPVLAPGEPGVEIDTGQAKIGDGVKPWNELDYIGNLNRAILTIDGGEYKG